MNKRIKYKQAKYALNHFGEKKIKQAQGEIQEVDENQAEEKNQEDDQKLPKIQKQGFVLDCITGKMPEYNSKNDKHLQHFYIRKKLIRLLRRHEINSLHKKYKKKRKGRQTSKSVNVTRHSFFKNNLKSNVSSKGGLRSRSSQRVQEKPVKPRPINNKFRISGLKKAKRHTSRNVKNKLNRKGQTQRVFSSENTKDGFFLTSVNDIENADKENNPELSHRKPMFANLNPKPKTKKPFKNLYSTLGRTGRLPSVKRGLPKTSLGFLNKQGRISRNTGGLTHRTSRSRRTNNGSQCKGKKKIPYMTKGDFRSLLEKYKKEVGRVKAGLE
ncbi:unnamed protein product [Moneuplotes crassus]|uniref:Uncharacterized protein n=1 Tax=Euplotes crassus TaxID=5936 RepID=A0AAD1UJ39_EUPCR|nr:unnamed protein product [Moneuplotes crassus]